MEYIHVFLSFRIAGVFLAVSALSTAVIAQTSRAELGAKLGIDERGNVWVTSSSGRQITMAPPGHCLEVVTADDRQSMGCLVSRGVDDHGFVSQRQVEIYRVSAHKFVLEPGGPIREWHFWNSGRKVAILFQSDSGDTVDALYDTQSGTLIERVQEPADLARLPQWAKSHAQLSDESVPMSPARTEERNKWMEKMMRQIATIKPRMHRRDLSALFREDGGITFFNGPNRYILRECPLIKIDVLFKLSDKNGPSNTLDDVIESVSKPYLEYPFAD